MSGHQKNRKAERQAKNRQAEGLADKQTLKYLPILYCSAALQAGSRQAGRQADSQAGSKEVGQECRKDRRKAEKIAKRQEDKNAGGQEFRQADGCTERQSYKYEHTDIQK